MCYIDIVLLVRNELNPSVCDSLSSDFHEAIFVECKRRDNDTLTVGVLYRSPNSSKTNSEKLNTIIRNVERHKDKNIFFIGDFNYPIFVGRLNQSKIEVNLKVMLPYL